MASPTPDPSAEPGMDDGENSDGWPEDLPVLDWDATYDDPPALLPHGLSMNSVVYTKEPLPTPEDNDPEESDESEEMIPALEEDSWWYSDSRAPESKYDEWYLSSGDCVSNRPRSRRYRGTFNIKSTTTQTDASLSRFETNCGDDDYADYDDAVLHEESSGASTPVMSRIDSSDEFLSISPSEFETDEDNTQHPAVVGTDRWQEAASEIVGEADTQNSSVDPSGDSATETDFETEADSQDADVPIGPPRQSTVEMELQRLAANSVMRGMLSCPVQNEYLDFFNDADRTAGWSGNDSTEKMSNNNGLEIQSDMAAEEHELEAVTSLMKRVQSLYRAGAGTQLLSRSELAEDDSEIGEVFSEASDFEHGSESDEINSIEQRVSYGRNTASSASDSEASDHQIPVESERNTDEDLIDLKSATSSVCSFDDAEDEQTQPQNKPEGTPRPFSRSTKLSRIPVRVPTTLVETFLNKRSSLGSLGTSSSSSAARTRKQTPFLQLCWIDAEDEDSADEPELSRKADSLVHRLEDEFQVMASPLIRGSVEQLVCPRCGEIGNIPFEMDTEVKAVSSNGNPRRKPTVIENFQAFCPKQPSDSNIQNLKTSTSGLDSMQFIYLPNVLDSKPSFFDQLPESSKGDNTAELELELESKLRLRASDQKVPEPQTMDSPTGTGKFHSAPSVQAPRFHPYQSVAQRLAQLRNSNTNLAAEPHGHGSPDQDYAQNRLKSVYGSNSNLDFTPATNSLRDVNSGVQSATASVAAKPILTGPSMFKSSRRLPSKIPILKPVHHSVSVPLVSTSTAEPDSEAKKSAFKTLPSKIPVYKPNAVIIPTSPTIHASANASRPPSKLQPSRIPVPESNYATKLPVPVKIPATPSPNPQKSSRIPIHHSRQPESRNAANFNSTPALNTSSTAKNISTNSGDPKSKQVVNRFGFPVQRN